MRRHYGAIVAFFRYLVALLQTQEPLYEALDSTGVPTRDAKRRGAGWLAGQADIGWSNRLGWYEGFHVLLSVNPQEDFLACWHCPHPRMPTVGNPGSGYYVVDKGFEGKARHQRWHHYYGARVVCPPKSDSRQPWPKRLGSWVAGLRQIVETVSEKLHHTFGLDRERPHELAGFQARLAAKAALHNFCIWLNGKLGRHPLAFATLLVW